MTTSTHDAQTTILDAEAEGSDDTKEGLFPDMPAGEYYDLNRPGSTALRHATGTPAEFAKWYESDSTPMGDGQAIGQALGYALFDPDYWLWLRDNQPKVDMSSRYNLAAHKLYHGETSDDDIREIADDKGVQLSTAEGYFERDDVQAVVQWWRNYEYGMDLSDDQIETVEQCAESVRDHDEASQYLDVRREVAVLGSLNGMDVRGRLDGWNPDTKTIVELKTVSPRGRRSAAPDAYDGWGYEIADRNYHMQAGLYWRLAQEAIEGDEIVDFYWIAVETEPPYLVGCYQPDDDLIAEGLKCCEDAVETIRAYRNGDRSGYGSQGHQIDIPDHHYQHPRMSSQ